MWNFEHEIPCPDNRAIQCYLWYDWFHDSAIKRFDFQEADLIVTVQCCRDMDAFFDRHKSWPHERCREYIHSHLEEFTYHLRFTRLAYFRTDFAHELNNNDYINGRFKQSALLRRLQAQNPKARYHLRIQTANGYMDIVFQDFQIRKGHGRVRYYPVDFHNVGLYTAAPLKYVFAETEETADDDFDRFQEILCMQKEADPRLLEVLRRHAALDMRYEDSCILSLYLLGKYGDTVDLPLLMRKLEMIESELEQTGYVVPTAALLPKRIILDAVEEIQERAVHPPV